MTSLTNEFKVGLFVIVSVGMMIFGYFFALDSVVRPGEAVYHLQMTVPNADGLYAGSAVQIAGVKVGSISDIVVQGNRARVILEVKQDYRLPVDSQGEIKASGLLGDTYIRLIPGREPAILPDNGVILLAQEPGDIDVITRQVEDISDDIRAITKVLREMAENSANKDHAEATLANVDELSAELKLMAVQNRQDINDIVDSIKRLTLSLEGFAGDTRVDVNEEMDKLKGATDTLQKSLDNVESITGKVDRGEGTVGALINDRDTIDALNDTINNTNAVVKSFSGMHADVYYIGRYFIGTEPRQKDIFFYGNPYNLQAANAIGLNLHSTEDFWYIFEILDYPQGILNFEERYVPATGAVTTEWIRTDQYRFSFMISKRFRDISGRLGIKEGGGGVGISGYLFKDKLTLSADVFDFTYGAYPAIESSGLPNLRLSARLEPVKHVYFDAGAEQVLLGARYGFFTGFVGAGFHFTDDDIKLLFATLPIQ